MPPGPRETPETRREVLALLDRGTGVPRLREHDHEPAARDRPNEIDSIGVRRRRQDLEGDPVQWNGGGSFGRLVQADVTMAAQAASAHATIRPIMSSLLVTLRDATVEIRVRIGTGVRVLG